MPAIEELDLGAVWAAEPPVIDFVLPGLAIGTVGLVVATGGTGKTFAMLATALGVAVGRDVGDVWGDRLGAGDAVFIGLEDPEDVLRSRLHALRSRLHDEEFASACARLHVLSCAGRGLAFASPSDGEPELSEWFGQLEKHLRAIAPRLCVVDTLNRALGGVSENDAGAMGWIIGQIERVAREARCAIVLCHHVSKLALTLSSAGEAHAARGSSVITDNARWQCNLTMPNDADQRFKGMTDAARRCFVQLSFSKMNYGPPLPPRWLHRAADGVLSRSSDVADVLPRAQVGAGGGAAGVSGRGSKLREGSAPSPKRPRRSSPPAKPSAKRSFEGDKAMRIA